jgi:hypothetical protein
MSSLGKQFYKDYLPYALPFCDIGVTRASAPAS